MSTTIENAEKIPWHRRRWFWGLVLSPFFFYALGLSLLELLLPYAKPDGLLDFIFRLCVNFGGFPIISIISVFFGRTDLGINIGMLCCVVFFAFLAYKTFKNRKVKIKYPIILLLLIITGIIIGIPVS